MFETVFAYLFKIIPTIGLIIVAYFSYRENKAAKQKLQMFEQKERIKDADSKTKEQEELAQAMENEVRRDYVEFRNKHSAELTSEPSTGVRQNSSELPDSSGREEQSD